MLISFVLDSADLKFSILNGMDQRVLLSICIRPDRQSASQSASYLKLSFQFFRKRISSQSCRKDGKYKDKGQDNAEDLFHFAGSFIVHDPAGSFSPFHPGFLLSGKEDLPSEGSIF